MLTSKIRTGSAIRIALALLLLAAVAAVVVAAPSVAPREVALADDEDDGDDGDDGNQGRGNDGKESKEKEPKEKKPKGEGNGNGDGHGKNDDETPIVIVQAPNTTPVVVTPAPTPTAAPRENGRLLVLVRSCTVGTPLPAADWTTGCTASVTDAEFELVALDGPYRGWHRDLESAPEGEVDVTDLPAGRYDLTPDGTRWCHAESDRVDGEGRLSVVAGQTTTVWIFTCDAAK